MVLQQAAGRTEAVTRPWSAPTRRAPNPMTIRGEGPLTLVLYRVWPLRTTMG
jgi:hypothetical protein